MKSSLIAQTFIKTKNENRPALLTYTVAGDDTKKNSLEILRSISKYADICELGFPHNTPIADGGQIQTSSYRAIKNGVKINDVFSIVNQFKKYKENNFIKKCKKSKVDGLIVVDLPYPENKSFALKCKKNGVEFIQLISPTTSKKRLEQILRDSHNMLYYISMLSTTGGKLKVAPKKILQRYNKIKSLNRTKNIVIGFGITENTIKSLKKADGLVVGSAICKEITNSINKGQNIVTNVTNKVKKLKNKIR